MLGFAQTPEKKKSILEKKIEMFGFKPLKIISCTPDGKIKDLSKSPWKTENFILNSRDNLPNLHLELSRHDFTEEIEMTINPIPYTPKYYNKTEKYTSQRYILTELNEYMTKFVLKNN